MRILVVDDNSLYCELIQEILSRAGHSITFCGSGDEALKALEKIRYPEEQFDLAIVDVSLPDIEGLELAAVICNLNTAILILTGYPITSADLVKHGLSPEIKILTKPCDLNTLLVAVASFDPASRLPQP